MNQRRISPCTACRRAARAVLLMGLAWLHVAAVDTYEQIATANHNYASGKYEEALRGYEAALAAVPEGLRAELLHNLAAAHYKLGNFQDAREAWIRAAGMRDARFEAAARYNLGNCDYAEALRIAADSGGQVDASRLVELLERAQRQYQDAIALDPALHDARANLELAERLIRYIRENAATQPSSQSSSSDGSDDSPESTTQPQGDQKSEESSSSSQPEDGDGTAESQPGSPSTQSSQSQPNQDAQEPQSQPADSSPSNEEPASQPDSSSSQAEQQAAQPETQPSGQPQTQPSSGETQENDTASSRSDISMTPAEAERLLQKIRDAEKQRRQRLLQRERAKQRPVDKDW